MNGMTVCQFDRKSLLFAKSEASVGNSARIIPRINDADLYESERKMSTFRIFGAMSVAFGCIFLVVIVVNRNAPAEGHHLGLMFGPTAVMVAVGIGLLLHQRVAAAIFVCICAGTALKILISATARTPVSWEDFVFAAIILAPALVSLVFWQQLGKSKKGSSQN